MADLCLNKLWALNCDQHVVGLLVSRRRAPSVRRGTSSLSSQSHHGPSRPPSSGSSRSLSPANMQGYAPPGQGSYYPSQYPPQNYVPSYPYPGYPVKPVVPQPAPPQGYPFPGMVYPPQEQYEPAPPMQPHHSESSSKSRHKQRESGSSGLRRSHTTPPPRAPNPNAMPGKSALKKSQQEVRSSSRASGQQSQNNLSRTSSKTSDQRLRTDSTSSRQRSNSIPSFLSGTSRWKPIASLCGMGAELALGCRACIRCDIGHERAPCGRDPKQFHRGGTETEHPVHLAPRGRR